MKVGNSNPGIIVRLLFYKLSVFNTAAPLLPSCFDFLVCLSEGFSQFSFSSLFSSILALN